MENASKALVIAGAILISILIIGLGVFIYNSASSTVKKANLSSQEAQAQNQQFEAYFGAKKSSADVKALMSLVRSNNITGTTNDEQKYIAVAWGTTYAAPSVVSSSVKAGKTYTVEVLNDLAVDDADTATTLASGTTVDAAKNESYYSTGFIRIIHITEN